MYLTSELIGCQTPTSSYNSLNQTCTFEQNFVMVAMVVTDDSKRQRVDENMKKLQEHVVKIFECLITIHVPKDIIF